MRISFLCLCLCFLQACSGAEDSDVAKEMVVEFHQRFNAGKYKEIYKLSGDEIKNTATEDDFIKILEKASKDLGFFKNKVLLDIKHTSYIVGETKATLIYKSTYSIRDVNEEFWFSKTNSGWVLVGYSYKS